MKSATHTHLKLIIRSGQSCPLVTAVKDWATSQVRCKDGNQTTSKTVMNGPITEDDFPPGDEEQGGGVCLSGHHPCPLRLLQDLLQQVLTLSHQKVIIHFLAGAVSSWKVTH